ncbi:MAG: FAD-binding oxidoreductase [Gemmobacter sp.]
MTAAQNAALPDLIAALGPAHVLTGPDMAAYTHDWTGKYTSRPSAVVRPGTTAEVAAVMRVARSHGLSVIPAGGRTGLVGGLMTHGGLMVSLDRMNRIRALRPASRIVIAEAGVILSTLHDAAAAQGLYFPLWFGARGSATLGGVLSTNAGGSNVVRYGSTRALCLGVEAVLADGRVLNLMSELHKDNSGYALKDLFIGAEGTLGLLTAAVMKLVPAPRGHTTAMVALRSLDDALSLLNRLQEATGGAVAAFEYMPASYMRRLAAARPDIRLPFARIHDVAILVEIATTIPDLATPRDDGSLPLTDTLETVLAAMLDQGAVTDAEIARSDAQRSAMWQRRELAAEVTFARKPTIDTDVSLPLDRVGDFLRGMEAALPVLDPGADSLAIAHLGDGNVHYTVFPSRDDPVLAEAVVTRVEDEVQRLGGSFSAEHGVGLSKKGSMARRKDPVALEVMRAVKHALDPEGRMNPGKVLPDS